MSYVIPVTATHVAEVCIKFQDQSEERFPVCFGSLEECDRIARDLPAVSTSRPGAVSASVSVFPLAPRPWSES